MLKYVSGLSGFRRIYDLTGLCVIPHHHRITADTCLHTSLEQLDILIRHIAPEMHFFRIFELSRRI